MYIYIYKYIYVYMYICMYVHVCMYIIYYANRSYITFTPPPLFIYFYMQYMVVISL